MDYITLFAIGTSSLTQTTDDFSHTEFHFSTDKSTMMKVYSLIAILPLAYAAAINGPVVDALPAREAYNETQVSYLDLAKRDDIKVLCGAPPSMPDTDIPLTDFNWSIGVLIDAGSKRLHVEAGPSNCVQASCSKVGGAGVYLCNDQPNPIDIQYSDIAFFAQQVTRTCQHVVGDTNYVRKGQAFCPDSWNVILTELIPCIASGRP
ncbi:hypothetical protein F5B20DRAFT_585029 [Whalleya microplaca]|nr:hypothetical protein F5B20DRAFT_585029 [Whalleya microplaca]